MNQPENAALKKDIGLFLGLSIVVGTIIGSGVFMKPGPVLSYAGSADMAMLAWLIGGLLTLAGGLTIAEVGVQIPKTGGLYAYLEETYGEIWGFLCGWVQTILYGPAIIAALGLYFGTLMVNLFGWSTTWTAGVGIASVLFLCIINIIGTKFGGIVQLVTTIGKLLPIILIVIFGFWKGDADFFSAVPEALSEINFGAAVLATLFAYDGWIMLASMGGEMKDPEKTLPRAMIGGILIVTACYLLINAAMLYILPAAEIVSLNTNAASTAAKLVLGDTGEIIVSLGIIVSIFGCLNGKILTFPRIPFAMAERGQLPFSNLLQKVHPTFQTPWVAVVLQLVLSVIFMLVSNPDKLSEISIFTIYLFYVLAFYAVFILRKRHKGKERAYSVPLYPFIPIAAIAGSLFVLISTLFTDFLSCLLSIGIAVIGLPIFYALKAKKRAE
ncbi:APC family permease [Terribacillus sp. DMT04]|uniref:APC family permease n=1 Tax=Terribacillus sp. DMT04 TaxID=2850441 RepID=UPI001C2BF9A4|nr:amino acid permease [Terribacillus sp. DMT04]QXE01688.1 amino acid permease [Terribacillus sp. DMT04]